MSNIKKPDHSIKVGDVVSHRYRSGLYKIREINYLEADVTAVNGNQLLRFYTQNLTKDEFMSAVADVIINHQPTTEEERENL